MPGIFGADWAVPDAARETASAARYASAARATISRTGGSGRSKGDPRGKAATLRRGGRHGVCRLQSAPRPGMARGEGAPAHLQGHPRKLGIALCRQALEWTAKGTPDATSEPAGSFAYFCSGAVSESAKPGTVYSGCSEFTSSVTVLALQSTL